ncbi:hypothetical protein BDV10DRAFT_191897 [Aspergillus recurvatus]
MTMLLSIQTRMPALLPIDPYGNRIVVMATELLYPEYLPVRPEGFTPTLDIPAFEAEEPGLRTDTELPDIFSQKTILKNVTPRIWTEIQGLQLSQLTPAGLDQVALLAARRRDQDFTDIGPERQLAIARHFGPLRKHPTMGYPKGTGPEFQVVYADEKVGNLRSLLGPRTNYDLWHIDQTFTPNTPSLTVFWVLEIPASGGGDTAFTSLTAAYNALSPAFREGLHRLKLLHTSASVGEVVRLGQERALKEAVKTEHPLVISHPASCMITSDHWTFSCRVSWGKGTVIAWDQRTVAHSAIPDFKEGERRHMVRINPYGSQPRPL